MISNSAFLPRPRRAVLVVTFLALLGGQALAAGEIHTYSKPEGPLVGRHVVISPGHGVDENNNWDRPLLYGLREDIHVNEIPIVYLQRYLHNAGATVHFVRERSFQEHEIIIENGDPGYSETGTWTDSQWGDYTFHSTTDSQPHASAYWTPDFPENGFYPIYVNVLPGGNRSRDALYRVHHAGGTTEIRFDQSKYPESWIFLGTFFFLAGQDTERGSLELSSEADTGNVVIADKVRFGGGANSAHGLARWYEQARLSLDHYGYPYAQSDGNLASRPRYGSWLAGLHGEPSSAWTNDWRYLSIHTNAANGTARGTRTFVYSNGRPPAWGSAGSQTHDLGLQAVSDAFGDRMHTQFVDDMRGLWEPNWSGGVGSAQRMNFSELRNCVHMPSCLLELAFHDNATDAGYIRNAQWRHDAARAMYKGLLRDFHPTATVLPLPPSNVRVRQSTAGEYTVEWTATDDPLESSATPDHYLVYRSDNGYGWDNGTVVNGTSETFSAEPGEVVYLRVTAVNDGGVSLPSKAVAVRIAAGDNHGGLLLVDGFTRPFTHVVTTSATQPSNVQQRYRDNYVVEVLEGLVEQERMEVPVDSTLAEAVAAGLVDLADYHAVIWFLGTESSEQEALSATERSLIEDYLANAEQANLFVSGANLATHLGSAAPSFLATVLGAEAIASSTGSYTAEGLADTPFEGVSLTFGDGSSGAWGNYDVDEADVLGAVNDGLAVMNYGGSGTDTAVVLRDTPNGNVLTMGFPVERIVERSERAAVMEVIVDTLLADYTPPGQEGPEGNNGVLGSESDSCGALPAEGPLSGAGGALLAALLLLLLGWRLSRD